MPWTNYPNGVSVTTATGTASGVLTCTSIDCSGGTATATSYIGETAAFSFYNVEVGTALDSIISAPFAGKFGDMFVISSTGAINGSLTVHASSVTSGGAIGTLAFTSGTNNKVTSGSVNAGTFSMGSQLIMTSAAAGSDGSAYYGFSVIRTG